MGSLPKLHVTRWLQPCLVRPWPVHLNGNTTDAKLNGGRGQHTPKADLEIMRSLSSWCHYEDEGALWSCSKEYLTVLSLCCSA